MPNAELLVQAQELADKAAVKAEEYSGLFGSLKDYIVGTFGQNGLIAFYVVTAALLVFVIAKLAKLTLSTLKYLVVPAVALAFLATFVTPLSFIAALPITVTVCSVFLLFKG